MNFVKWLSEHVELFKGLTTEETVFKINNLSASEEGKETLEQLTKQYKNTEMGIFKEGGKLDYLLCLKKGGRIQDCGCGKKIEKAQGGSDGLRERGSINAYDERYPEFNRDSTWSIVHTQNGPAYVKNVFSGNDLEQNVVTEGIHGVPRRTIRSITNYDNPAKSDTTYIDANGLEAGRNPGILARILGNVHSDKFMNNIDSILNGMEPRQLSEKEVKRTKKNKEGGILFAQSGAAGFYRNWSEDDIRALKNKLAGYAGYEGDLTSGKVDSGMIEAVKRYQRDHKLKDDGMWGHNTNSIQKMLDPSIMDKGSYKKSYKTEQGDLYTHNTLKKPSSDKGIYTQISELQSRAISNPEWFWGDSQDARDARAFFYQNWKKPEEATAMKSIIDNIYSETPREIKNKIDAKKLPQHIQQARMNAGITDATGKVADFVATKALPAMALPLSAAAAPLATVGGLAGGALGSVVGGNTLRNLHEGDNANYEVTDELGNTAAVVRDPDQYYYNQGALVGGALGGVFGSMAPGALKYGTEHLYGGRTRPSRVSDHKGPHGYRGGDGKFIHADNEGWFDGGNIFDFSRGLLFKKGGKL